ncbi:MAG: histidinol dehydrogenase [Paludibaculum sp.]
MIRILPAADTGRLLQRKAARFDEAEQTVRPILDAVRKRGDKAVIEYARKFDALGAAPLRVPTTELEAAANAVTPAFRKAVETAAKNISAYAKLQLPQTKQKALAPGLIARPDRPPARLRRVLTFPPAAIPCPPRC